MAVEPELAVGRAGAGKTPGDAQRRFLQDGPDVFRRVGQLTSA